MAEVMSTYKKFLRQVLAIVSITTLANEDKPWKEDIEAIVMDVNNIERVAMQLIETIAQLSQNALDEATKRAHELRKEFIAKNGEEQFIALVHNLMKAHGIDPAEAKTQIKVGDGLVWKVGPKILQ